MVAATAEAPADTKKNGKRNKPDPAQQPLEDGDGTILVRLGPIEKAGGEVHRLKLELTGTKEKLKDAKAVLRETMEEQDIEEYDLQDYPGFKAYCRRSDKFNIGTEPIKEVRTQD